RLPAEASGDDRQGAGVGAQLDPGPIADVVAVDLQREGLEPALPVLGYRVDGGGADVVEMLDLAVARGRLVLAEEARDQGRHVALGGALQDPDRERAVVDRDPLADADRAAGEVGEGVRVLGNRGYALRRPAAGPEPHSHRVDQIPAVEGRD